MQLLRRGDSGPAVVEIRGMLTRFGLLAETSDDALLDGSDGPGSAPSTAYFDPVVEHAVRAFQQRRGLITDGIVGPATYRALQSTLKRFADAGGAGV